MKILLYQSLIAVALNSCGLYSYPSVGLSPTYKVSIGNIKNNVLTQDPDISYKINEKLEQKFRQDPNWQVVDEKGVLDFQGVISDYKVETIAIGANQVAKLNRVTLTINIQAINEYLAKEKINENIIEYIEYDAHKNLGIVRDSLHNTLVNKLADEIYNGMTNNW